mmetsp:Transcript_6610/g.12913  ORF Transcript_6610/g.12913 Transcript_6610/m.12913 type:complete len:427 (-) Transcript_6610:63-1343(-)
MHHLLRFLPKHVHCREQTFECHRKLPGKKLTSGSGTMTSVTLSLGMVEFSSTEAIDDTVKAGKLVDAYRQSYSTTNSTDYANELLVDAHDNPMSYSDVVSLKRPHVQSQFEGSHLQGPMLALLDRKVSVSDAIAKATPKELATLFCLAKIQHSGPAEKAKKLLTQFLVSYHDCDERKPAASSDRSINESLSTGVSLSIAALSPSSLLIAQMSLVLTGGIYSCVSMYMTTWITVIVQLIRLGCSKTVLLIHWQLWKGILHEAELGGYKKAFVCRFIASWAGFDGSIMSKDDISNGLNRIELIVPETNEEQSIKQFVVDFFMEEYGLEVYDRNTKEGTVNLTVRKSKVRGGKDICCITIAQEEPLKRIARDFLRYIVPDSIPPEKFAALKSLAGPGFDCSTIGESNNVPSLHKGSFQDFVIDNKKRKS